MTQDKTVNRYLEESYAHIKPYLKDQEVLKEMCKNCEMNCGEDHDYEECRDKPCFRCYLAYEYLIWSASFEGGSA